MVKIKNQTIIAMGLITMHHEGLKEILGALQANRTKRICLG